MMFLFVAMIHLPGAIASGARIPWTIVFREMSFGGGGWVLAGIAMSRKSLITVGSVLVAITAIFFGVQHLLHPLALPGVPLVKEMPEWVPAHMAAAYLGSWIVLLVVVIYGPVLVGALANPNAGVKVEGLNYFADTLLFGGVILSVARATAPDRQSC